MTEISTAGRINEPVFQGITGTLFGLAILTATVRTVYRVQSHGRLLLDDYMLIFACVTLTVANGILFSLPTFIYWNEYLILHPDSPIIQTTSAATVARISRYQQMLYSSLTLTWTTIFAVKICFLLFFLQIVDRLKKLMLIWKIVFCVTVLIYPLCVCGIFLSCPHFGLATLNCAHNTGFTVNLAFSLSGIVLDITSDFLIIMIPLLLLWKAKIKRSQKTFVGIFLCLSIGMIVIAIVRLSGLRVLDRYVDVQWEVFWLELEANVAVIMVSITAFRSLLGLKALKSRKEKERVRYWYRRRLPFSKGDKTWESQLNGHQLPSIPGATLTGIRTFIRGDRESKMMGSRFDVTDSRGDRTGTEQRIKVTHTMSSESENVGSSMMDG